MKSSTSPSFLASLLQGEEVTDPEEEAFLLFSQPRPSAGRDLGMVDPHARAVEVSVAGRDLVVHQNPAVLTSARKEGTTGAVLWKVTPPFTSWLLSPTNPLSAAMLGPHSTVLELGAGTSGVLAACLASRVRSYVVTDLDYALKLLRRNIEENLAPSPPVRTSAAAGKGGKATRARGKKMPAEPPGGGGGDQSVGNVQVLPLDWETDSMADLPRRIGLEEEGEGVDVVIALDCVYNEALVRPLVNTARDICRLRRGGRTDQGGGEGRKPTVVLVGQQLRAPEVFELWIREFWQRFRVWRVDERALGDEFRASLGEGSGFVVHVGVLREE